MIKKIIYLIIFIFILNIFYFYRFIDTKRFDEYIRKPIHLDEIKTGDVMIISYQNLTTVMTGSFLRTKFLHPAIAVWDKGELFMIELINYSKEDRGFLKVPIDKWVRYNRNALVMINKLEITKENESEIREDLSEKILDFYDRGKDKLKHVGAFNLKWLRFLYPETEYKQLNMDDKNIVCIETISAVLVETGIARKNKSLDQYIPDSYIGMKDFDLEDGFLFKESYICDFSSFKSLIYK